MSGYPFPRNGALGFVLVAMVIDLATACVVRETSDDERPMHPPELLAEHDAACADYCDALEECGRTDFTCCCEQAIFEDKHTLCVEKSIAKLECLASTSCELLETWPDLPQQDRPCYGEGVAESVACRPLR